MRGCADSQRAKAKALADWARIRIPKVSKPFKTTHALNGDKVIPALRMTGANTLFTKSALAHRAPAMTRPCPSNDLVPECTMISAPSVIGFCKMGDAKQLSTANQAPAARAISASAAMSHTSVNGLVGVSANNSLVWGVTAARHSSRLVCATKLVVTPNLANSLPMSLMVEPNMECEQTTWSPLFNKPMHNNKMADMPVEVAMAAGASSIAAKRCSKLVTVGLPSRE